MLKEILKNHFLDFKGNKFLFSEAAALKEKDAYEKTYTDLYQQKSRRREKESLQEKGD